MKSGGSPGSKERPQKRIGADVLDDDIANIISPTQSPPPQDEEDDQDQERSLRIKLVTPEETSDFEQQQPAGLHTTVDEKVERHGKPQQRSGSRLKLSWVL